jgi:hypothetical protein
LSHSIILIMVTVWPNCATLKQLNDTSYALISLPHHDSLGQHVSGLICRNFTLLGRIVNTPLFIDVNFPYVASDTRRDTLFVSFHETLPQTCCHFSAINN